MAFNNIEILCRCLQWDSSVPSVQRSIWNTSQPPSVIGGLVDLMPYCIELDKISFSGIGDNISEDINALYYDAGDVRLSLSGIKNNKFLQSYFSLFDVSGLLQYRQYHIEIRYNAKCVFAGIVTQDSISENFSPSVDSEIIKLHIVGLEKEFKNYFSFQSLVDHSLIFDNNGDTHELGWNRDPRTEDNGINAGGYCRSASLRHVMNSNMQTGNLVLTNGLADAWFVNNIPQFFYNPVQNIRRWFLRTGYKRWIQQGYSFYEMFDKLCNGMGWVWYIKRRPFTPSHSFVYDLHLEDRSAAVSRNEILDYNKIINYEIGYKITKTDFEYIVIPDGNIHSFGFYHTAGNLFKMLSKKLSPIYNNSYFFKDVTGNPNGYQLYPLPFGEKYTLENEKSQNKMDWAEVSYNGSPNWNDNRIVERKFIESTKILYIDAGENTVNKTGIDTRDGFNHVTNDQGGMSDRGVLYSGNVASMLFQYHPYPVGGQVFGTDYNDYSQGQQFKDNFNSILNSINTQTLTVEYNGIFIEPKSSVSFTNSNISFFQNSTFNVNDLQVDLINEVTTLTLTRTT